MFVDFYRRSDDFAGEMSGLRSLLFTIAYRRIADVHRLSARRPELLVPVPRQGTSGSSAGPVVEDAIVSTETLSAAMAALSKLTERERSVITMRIFEEASPEEVSRRLGLTNVNVRVIQARAFRKVRAALEANGHLRHPLAVVMSLSSLRHFTFRLPSKGALGRWIEEVRAQAVALRVPFEGHPRLALHDGGPGSQLVDIWSQVAMRAAVVVSALALGAAVVIPGWVPGEAQGTGGETEGPAISTSVGPDSNESEAIDETRQSSDAFADTSGSSDPLPNAEISLPSEPSERVGIIAPAPDTLTLLAEVDGKLIHVVSTLAQQVTDTLLNVADVTLADVSGAVSGIVDSAAGTTERVATEMAELSDTTIDTLTSAADDVVASTEDAAESPLIDSAIEPSEEIVENDRVATSVEDIVETVDDLMSGPESVSEGLVDDVVEDGLGLFD